MYDFEKGIHIILKRTHIVLKGVHIVLKGVHIILKMIYIVPKNDAYCSETIAIVAKEGYTVDDGGDMMRDVKSTAGLWGISATRVTRLCRDGKIPGAVKSGKSWLIPEDAVKPADGRRKRAQDDSYGDGVKRLPLPIGISEYRLASTQYYYIDKTMLIKDFLDERPMVSLYTRPRRFGKTLNMDMLRTFFERTKEDTSVYFQGKGIWNCGEEYRAYQGKYPVIFVSFKDIKFHTWEETLAMLRAVIGNEFVRHGELEASEKCSDADRKYYREAAAGETDAVALSRAFEVLSRMLYRHHGTEAIIIIDEYDIPIQQGHTHRFYDQVIDFMRNLFSGGLKDNKYLAYGFLTGILRVAKESIFSGLNNLVIHSVIDDKYSQYFGFTKEEVERMAAYYRAENKLAELCEWYDGYRFGDTEIFNPWSVINYFSIGCKPRAFWQSTGSNEIISEVIAGADEEIYERLEKLLLGEKFTTLIDTGVIYPQIQKNHSTIYSFLLVAGYLKAENVDISPSGDFMGEVSLPNREIKAVYNKEILQKLDGIVSQSSAVSIQEAVYANDITALQKSLEKLLLQSASSFDTAGEMFFHGLFLGICALFDDRYYLTSNRESGEGRFDIQLMPKDDSRPGILIELKAKREYINETQLEELAQSALAQINDRKYDTDMKTRGVKTIFKYGVAFQGKNVKIVK